MKRRVSLALTSALLVLSILLGLVGCGYSIDATDLMTGFEAKAVDGKEADEAFIENQMSLALKLFKSSSNESKKENVLVSPLSVQLALAMTANGASGQTKAEMEELLGGEISLEDLNNYLYTYVKNLPTDEKYKLEIANSIWFKDGGINVNDSFLQTNKNYYDAGAYMAPFDNSTVDDINNWVSNKTDDMIEEIVTEIDSGAVMYLINAVMFDAEWQDKYEEKNVRNGKFTSIAGEKQSVDMMRSTESVYIETENAIGFKKDYRNRKYSFVALLPNENIPLGEFVESLSAKELLNALENSSYATVYATMPKFSYEYELDMKGALISLGMSTAFDSKRADFSGIGAWQADGNAYINSVMHKAFISVDEAGTRAGAVTSVGINSDSAGTVLDPKIVTLDRPFLYMIIDNETNLPIFIGTLTSVE